MPSWGKSTNQIEYRLIDSARFDSSTFLPINIKGSGVHGVTALAGKLKKDFVPRGSNPDSYLIQSYRFGKDQFNINKAKQWARVNVDCFFNINNIFSEIIVPNDPIYILVKYVDGLGWVQIRDIQQGNFNYITDTLTPNENNNYNFKDFNKILLDVKINNYLCDEIGKPLEATVLVTQGSLQNLNEREYTPESLDAAVDDAQKMVRLGLVIGFDGHPGGAENEQGKVFGFDYTEKEPLYRVVALWFDKFTKQVWARIRFFNTPEAIAYCNKLRDREDVYVSLRALGPCEFINGKQVCTIDRIDGFDIVDNPALPTAKIYSISEINSDSNSLMDKINELPSLQEFSTQVNQLNKKINILIDKFDEKPREIANKNNSIQILDEVKDLKVSTSNNILKDCHCEGTCNSCSLSSSKNHIHKDEDLNINLSSQIPNNTSLNINTSENTSNNNSDYTNNKLPLTTVEVSSEGINSSESNNSNKSNEFNNLTNPKISKKIETQKLKSNKQSKPLIASASNQKGANLMLKQILMLLEKQGVDQRTLGRMEAAFAIGGVEALNSMLAESGVDIEIESPAEESMEMQGLEETGLDAVDPELDPNANPDPDADPNAENEEGQTVAGESEEGTTIGEEEPVSDLVVQPNAKFRPKSQYREMQDGTTPTKITSGVTPTKTKGIKPGTDEVASDWTLAGKNSVGKGQKYDEADEVEDGAEEVGVPITNPVKSHDVNVSPKPTMAYVDKKVKDAPNGKNLKTMALPVRAKHPGGKSQQEPVNVFAKSQGMKDMKNKPTSPLAKLFDNLNRNTQSQNQVQPQNNQMVLPPEYISLFKDMKAIVDQKKNSDLLTDKASALDAIIADGKIEGYDLSLLPITVVNAQKAKALADSATKEQAISNFAIRITTLVDAQVANAISINNNKSIRYDPQGRSAPEIIKDDQSWTEWDERLNQTINDYRKIYRPKSVKDVKEHAAVNEPFLLDMLKAWDNAPQHKKVLSDWARDQKRALRDGIIKDSALVIGANDFRNQPVIARVIIRQVFQRLMTLQLVQGMGPGRAVGQPGAGGLPFGGEFKFPVLSYNSPAHNRKRYVNGSDPIPQASSNLRFESFWAKMRALSFSIEDELRNQLQNGALGIDPVAIMLDDVTQDMARAIDTHILEEHQQTCDEWNSVAVVSELSIIGNTVYNAGANVTITYDGLSVVYPNGVFAVKLLSGAAGGIPIVMPRATVVYDQNGSQVPATLNAITVTFAATTQVMGELDVNNNVVSSNPISVTDAATTFAPDYEKGYLIFKANSGANGTLMPTTSYSYVTNYKTFALTPTSGVLPEDYYDGLLNLIMLTAGEMDSTPRFRQPDICLFPSSIAMGTIGISSLFHKRKSPDGLALERGFAQSDTLGNIHGIEMMRTNGQMFAGDRRAILFQRYMVGYGVQMPAIIKGPYNNFFANSNGIVQPTAGENWALEIRDVVGTPLPRNGSGTVINHPGITIRFTGRVSAVGV